MLYLVTSIIVAIKDRVMKKIICYFDNAVKKIFIAKLDQAGKKKISLSSPYNFVSYNEIVARVIDIENTDQIKSHLDKGNSYYKVIDY